MTVHGLAGYYVGWIGNPSTEANLLVQGSVQTSPSRSTCSLQCHLLLRNIVSMGCLDMTDAIDILSGVRESSAIVMLRRIPTCRREG